MIGEEGLCLRVLDAGFLLKVAGSRVFAPTVRIQGIDWSSTIGLVCDSK
jgi:hypothetical protein